MGARLVAASVPIYALGVAIAVFLAWQPMPYGDWWSGTYYGGIVALVATTALVAGAAAARAFSRRRALMAAGVALALVLAWIVATLARNYTVFYLAILAWFVFAELGLVVYPVLSWRLRHSAPELATHASLRAAPLAIAVLVATVALAPRYFSDAGEERREAVIATASLLAVIGAAAMALGVPTLRLSWRTIRLVLAAFLVIQVAVIVRGLPNPPMALARAPLLTIEYPVDRSELASDAPVFGDRLAGILGRSGAALPPGGVYVRYRFLGGPDGAPPPADALVLPAWADVIEPPAHRLRNFIEHTTVALVPDPGYRVRNAHEVWEGFFLWVIVLDAADARARIAQPCDMLVNKQQHIGGIEAAPYLRVEREQGVEASRALYARLLQSPPVDKEWEALEISGCRYVLSNG